MITIDAGDIAKLVAGFGSFGLSLSAGLAFFKPYAAQFLALRLERAKRRAEIEDAKDGAIERIAVQHERIVGVLEVYASRLDRIDARLDRIEAHHGISPTPSAIPAEAPKEERPRRQLTDPSLPRAPAADSTIPPLSVPAR